jgi:hypothetical protein
VFVFTRADPRLGRAMSLREIPAVITFSLSLTIASVAALDGALRRPDLIRTTRLTD